MECDNKCDECKIEEFCGYSVDTLGFSEFARLVDEHDKKIIAEALKPYDAESIEDLVENVRADAIEEMVDTLINPKNYERYDFDDCLSDSNKANDFFSYVFATAEQLMEQKNDSKYMWTSARSGRD